MPAQKRILCIGADPALLRTRCAVLVATGYDARCALYPDAERVLGTAQFDLVIVSAFLSDQEKERLLALTPGNTPTIVLRTLTLPPELIGLVEQRLAEDRERMNQSAPE